MNAKHSVPPPLFESWAARIGVGVLVLLSIVIGCKYWFDQNEPQLAVLTVGAELVAFAGLAAARHQFANKAWARGFGAVVVTVLAAIWCGMTMIQKIDADTRAKVVADAMARPAYVYAKRAADDANNALVAQSAALGPQCACPDSIRAWEEAQGAKVARLQADRDRAVGQLDTIIPAPKTDWPAIVRGAGVEIAKLLGFMVFGLVLAGAPKAPPEADTATAAAADTPAEGADTLPDTPPARAQRPRPATPELLEQVAYLRTINPRWATIWRLRKVAQRSYRGIADELGIKVPTVQRALKSAQKALDRRRTEALEDQNVTVLHPQRATA